MDALIAGWGGNWRKVCADIVSHRFFQQAIFMISPLSKQWYNYGNPYQTRWERNAKKLFVATRYVWQSSAGTETTRIKASNHGLHLKRRPPSWPDTAAIDCSGCHFNDLLSVDRLAFKRALCRNSLNSYFCHPQQTERYVRIHRSHSDCLWKRLRWKVFVHSRSPALGHPEVSFSNYIL